MGILYQPTEEMLNKIKDMASDGCTISQISALTGRDRGTIKRLLQRYSIVLRPSAKNKSGRKYQWGRTKIEKLKEFYASDQMNLDDIADYFETSKSTVVKYAATLGLHKVKKAFFKKKI